MNKNIGNSDVIVRLIIALALGIVVSSILISGIFAFIFMVTAVFLSVTSLFRFDPLYDFFRFNTRQIKKSEQQRKPEK